MKKRIVFSLFLLTLLSTIIFKQNIIVSKFNIKKVNLENNILLDNKDVEKLLLKIYEKNLFLLKNSEIENALKKNNFIESFEIKKKYPDTLNIKIFEKKPIAILINKKKKFYLSEKIDLINYKKLKNYRNLPIVVGKLNQFKTFHNNLEKINFPLEIIKKYTFFESNRWDVDTVDKKKIKLPSKNYTKSLLNYLNLKDKNEFKQYQIFDYRMGNQLILK